MALETASIDSEIERVDGLIVTVEAKITTASATLQKHKNRKSKLIDMRGRLGAAKAQFERFNILDKAK